MQRLRIKRTILRVAMTLLMMVLTSATAWADNVTVTSVSDFGTKTEGTTGSDATSGYYTLTSGNTYTLQNDVNIDGYLCIQSGTTVILDLNGHTLNRGLTTSTKVRNGAVIIVKSGTLTICDSGTGGTITGGYSIDGAGGVYMWTNSNVTMTGGTITGNYADNAVGGVFVNHGSTFTMTGGAVINNTCYNGSCGGVYFRQTKNGAHGTFNLSGSAKITGNKLGNATNNLYITNNLIVNIIGALTDAASIGVTMQTVGNFAQGSGYNITASDAGHFSSDVSGYYSMFDSGTGKLKFVDKDPALFSVLTWNKTGKYFEINDEQDLIDLANYVNGGSDNGCEGLTFKMTADLDFTTMPDNCHDRLNKGSGNFLPISIDRFRGYGSFFMGHFDGQGHTITGLRFNSTDPNIGLFSQICSPGTIIEGVTLVCPNFHGYGNVSGIVGKLYAGTVRNCAVVNGTISSFNVNVGGIVGYIPHVLSTDVKTISGCTVVGTTLSGTTEIGIIAGKNDDTSDATAALTISGCTYHNPDDLDVCGYGVGNRYTDGGGNQRVYQTHLADGLTASTAEYSYGNDYYFAENATVTLTANRPGYLFKAFESSDVTITDGAFTMPASDVSVSAQWYDPNDISLNGAGTEYTIKSATGWGVFCDLLANNDFGYFTGKTVKLGADIGTPENPITRMAGTSSHDFSGTFDGQDHTLTVSITGNNDYCGTFLYLKSENDDNPVNIQNLKVCGSVSTSKKYAGGIAGGCSGKIINIENCAVSVTINSSTSGDGTHGGFVGNHAASTLNITGCVFGGKLLTTNGTTNCGGFIGWCYNTTNITNCLYAPAALADGETEVSTTESMTFGRKSDATVTISNSFYTNALGTPQGVLAHSTATKPANIGIAVKDYDFVQAYTHGLCYGGRYYMTPDALTLVDYSANNVAAIDRYFATVTLSGRTLWKDGDWNTLCLPFNVSTTSGPLAGDNVVAMTLKTTTSGLSGTTLTLNFENAQETIPAGTPFIIKWATKENPAANLVSPVFSGVTIDNTDRSVTSSDGTVTFKGTYSPIVWNTENKSILFVGAGNTLYYPQPIGDQNPYLNAFRCYFELNDGSQAREFVLNFDDQTTGISDALRLNDKGQMTNDNFYDLQGRKIEKPTKGLYIHNGKKVVIK